MVAIGQTITIVNKSGKVVKTSKHWGNLFKEAKSAYLERKAELKTQRDDDLSAKLSAIESTYGSEAPRATTTTGTAVPPRPTYKEDDTRRDSHRSSRHPSRRSSTHDFDPERRHRSRRQRDSDDSTRSKHSHKDPASRGTAPLERGYSDSFYANDSPLSSHRPKRTTTAPLTASNLRHATTPTPSSPGTPRPSHPGRQTSKLSIERTELSRRHSDSETYALTSVHRGRGPSVASSTTTSDTEHDSDLAYGELPPPLPTRKLDATAELTQKMTALQRLLQEANCVQHSAKAVIKNLEDNPDAMASVALTLAEISNLAKGMAPGALMAMKGAFPMVVALLLSPEFLIAGGVALGVTVVSFGGYKIVKRMKVKKAKKLEEGGGDGKTLVAGEEGSDEEEEEENLEELSQIDRIDQWRRGIQLDPETMSVATSVEGEFVTPKAGRMLRDEGVLDEKDVKSTKGPKSKVKTTEKTKEEKEIEKLKKELAKKEQELQKKSSSSEKKEAKAAKKAEAEQAKAKKVGIEREKAEKKKAPAQKQPAQKQLTYREEDTETLAEPEKEHRDVQNMLKSIFKKEKKGEVVA